jgi:hypothetical protein
MSTVEQEPSCEESRFKKEYAVRTWIDEKATSWIRLIVLS